MRHEVFVYGSLKRGYWNNRFLQPGNMHDGSASFIGEACTKEFMLLIDGPFPYMAAPSQFAGIAGSPGKPGEVDIVDLAGNVYGEVWSVDDATLAQLDELEGCPNHYTRETIAVQFGPHNSRPVFAYRVANVERFRLRDFIKPTPENGALIWPTPRSTRMRA